MSEKKRVRPTVAQVRNLEDSLAAMKVLIDKKDELIRKLQSEVSTLEQSNRSMDGELSRKSSGWQTEAKKWKEKAIEYETELMRLRDRGFWARLFNR